MNCPTTMKEKRNGFTLVELLIVLFIIGLLTSVVAFSIPDDQGELEENAQVFAARISALRDNAILQSRPMAVDISPTGYGFLQRRAGEWQPLEDKPFRTTRFSGGVTAAVETDKTLRIAFESTGLAPDATSIILRRGDNSRAISITPMGEVKLQ